MLNPRLTPREVKIANRVLAANSHLPAAQTLNVIHQTLILARPKRSAPGFGKQLRGKGNG